MFVLILRIFMTVFRVNQKENATFSLIFQFFPSKEAIKQANKRRNTIFGGSYHDYKNKIEKSKMVIIFDASL